MFRNILLVSMTVTFLASTQAAIIVVDEDVIAGGAITHDVNTAPVNLSDPTEITDQYMVTGTTGMFNDSVAGVAYYVLDVNDGVTGDELEFQINLPVPQPPAMWLNAGPDIYWWDGASLSGTTNSSATPFDETTPATVPNSWTIREVSPGTFTHVAIRAEFWFGTPDSGDNGKESQLVVPEPTSLSMLSLFGLLLLRRRGRKN